MEDKLDLNTAELEQLLRLPRIGPVVVQRILEYRKSCSFAKPEDLLRIKGIGRSVLEAIKPFLIFQETGSREVWPLGDEQTSDSPQPSLDSLTDAELVRRAQEGDHIAPKELLVNRYADRIYRRCYELTEDIEDAKDLVQNVSERVLEKISFCPPDKFLPWVYGVIPNCWHEMIRDKPPEPINIDDLIGDGERLYGGIWDEHRSQLEIMIEKEKKEKVVEAINKLTLKGKSVIILTLEDLKFPEIAKLLDISMGAAQQRYRRALEKLRELLSSYINDE